MESFWGGQEKMAKSKARVNQCLGKGLSRKHRKKNKVLERKKILNICEKQARVMKRQERKESNQVVGMHMEMTAKLKTVKEVRGALQRKMFNACHSGCT